MPHSTLYMGKLRISSAIKCELSSNIQDDTRRLIIKCYIQPVSVESYMCMRIHTRTHTRRDAMFSGDVNRKLRETDYVGGELFLKQVHEAIAVDVTLVSAHLTRNTLLDESTVSRLRFI